MRRRIAIALLTVTLVVMAGCVGLLGSDGIDQEQLDRPAEYVWDHDADVYATVDDGELRVVYDLESTSEVEVTEAGWYQRQAADVWAVRFRYTNGTVINGSALDVDKGSSATTIELPAENGTLALSMDAGSRHVVVPGFVNGSYHLELPPGHRVDNFFLGSVSPSGYDDEVDDNRTVLTWSANDGDLSVQYFPARDHYIFYGVVILLSGLLLGGTMYYRRSIQRIANKRRELGLDVEEDEGR